MKYSTKQYNELFMPIQFGSVEAKNRLLMPAMVRNYADENGMVTPKYVAHIERIARGGVGTIVLEASYIHPNGKGFLHQLGVHTDSLIPGLKQLVDVAHAHGVIIGPQLFHAGRQTSSQVSGFQPVAPSAIADPTVQEVPRKLSIQEIGGIVHLYAQAARRAVEAGFDFVEIHAAHGYLITQFLSSFSNHRTDQYGGSFEHRSRFLTEVFEAVRNAAGEQFPILVRLSAEELVPSGITLKETVLAAQLLERLGAAAIDVSVGNYASYTQGLMIPPMAVVDGPLIHYAHSVKQAVHIPVITVGKIHTPEMVCAVVSKQEADVVAIGRTLLADPEWPNKVHTGRLNEINPCIACNQGCITRLFQQKDVRCTVNPETSREIEYSHVPQRKMKIIIIGGGPAGLEAARTAAARGHRVIIYERASVLGGQLHAATAAPYRIGWDTLRMSLVRDVQRLGVRIVLGVACTPALARRHKPDAIIIATGSDAIEPTIGKEAQHLYTARDVLLQRSQLIGDVVLIGGGCAGAQTAEYVAVRGFPTTLIHAGPIIADDSPSDEQMLLLERLKKMNVQIYTKTTASAFDQQGVTVQDEHGERHIHADTIILCTGSRSNPTLLDEYKKITKHTYVVGDAQEPRRVFDAMAEGAEAVLKSELVTEQNVVV